MKKMVWLNTTSVPENIFGVMRKSDDYVFVAPNTVDIRAFLDNVEEVQAMVAAGRLIFHAWFPSWEDQWNKDLWSSAIQAKVTAGTVRQRIPEAAALGSLIDRVAIPKEEWLPNQIQFTEALPALLAEVGVDASANRSQVKEACESNNRPDIWDAYEGWYVKKLAYQHGCCYTVNGNGEVVPV